MPKPKRHRSCIRGKKKKSPEHCCLRLETLDSCEPLELVTVHRIEQSDRDPYGSLFFLHGTVLHIKRTTKMTGSRFSRSDRTVWFEVFPIEPYGLVQVSKLC